jgi:polyisoprenoid-binding protein YceI
MTTIAPAATSLPTASWAIDPVHSSIGFGVKHLGISTYRGNFQAAAGRIVTQDGAVASVEGTVRIDTLATQDATLTGHLLTPDFFDAATHPEARFASTSITPAADGRLRIAGELTLRGVTRPVVLDGELEGTGSDPYGNERIGLVARGQIDRTEFGVNWNNVLANGALAVAEKVTLDLAVEAIAEAAA